MGRNLPLLDFYRLDVLIKSMSRRRRHKKKGNPGEIRMGKINWESRQESTILQYGLTHSKMRIAKDKKQFRNGPVKIIYSESLGIDNRAAQTDPAV
jgi:hypothetical protein